MARTPRSLPSLPMFVKVSVALHGAALATAASVPGGWMPALAVVIGNHLAITGASVTPRCGWLGSNTSRLPAAAARQGVVALTFDDGPDPEVTPVVLEMLARTRHRATFFCVGARARAHPDVIAAIRRQGHGVENHTYSHPNTFAFRGPAGLRQELNLAQAAIAQSGGGVPRFFRAPAGMQNPWLSSALADTGLALVSWTSRGFDTVTRDAARVAARLKRNLRGGAILLLHDASSARGAGGRPVVLDALSSVLDEMGRRGLRSETLHTALQMNDRHG